MSIPIYKTGEGLYYMYDVELEVTIKTRLVCSDADDIFEVASRQLDKDIRCEYEINEVYMTECRPDDI